MSMQADDWTSGYVAEVGYTYGYYSELNPRRIAAPFINVGFVPPPIATACELGFGQGLSVNIHAAASDIAWWGSDFNPGHAEFARELAAASGAGPQLFDQSFAEFCRREDLPDFDYLGLHGILSWVSEENQRIVIDFVRRKLKVGGVLYLSYNCQPGHAAMVPLRHLLTEHAARMTAPARGLIARIDAALDFAEALIALNPAFAVANPTIAERLKTLKGHDRHYLAHEYFNRDWRALPFAELAASLAPAKLTFACSSHYLDHLDALNMTGDQHRFLAEIPDPMLRQSVRDFIVNQQFRREYWVKGGRRLAPLAQAEALRRLRFVLLSARDEIDYTVRSPLGTRELAPSVYNPILDVLADHQPRSVGEIEEAVQAAALRLPAIFEGIMVLAGRGDLAVVQDDDVQAAARARTDRLNRHILERARSSGDVNVLASPTTGGGVGVARFFQLFLLAREAGRKEPDEMAQFAWDILAAQGQRVAKDGKALETDAENLAELARQAREFADKRLPLFRAAQLI
ncbi:MAG: class I SAM-dependent methyltransferase [Thiohalocapsa sp.]